MAPQKYTEQNFEEHIEEHLLKSGYQKRLPEDYSKELCLIPDDVIGFIKATQPKQYENLQKQYGAETDETLLYHIADEIHKNGTLDVLRKGFKDRGQQLRFAYFKPSSGMNPEHERLYRQNRFAVVRQLKYSTHNENSIDTVLFLNGLPIISMELKNSLTGQFVEQAIKQYRYDRDPREPFFHFKRVLVHFAVGNEKVYMTTRLSGDKTRFLPFNKDTENPVNPKGHKTAYLWEDVLRPDTLLDLIGNYLCVQINKEKYYDSQKGLAERKTEALIFPRYHQLDCVRTILNGVRKEGIGNNYLVQHSAGSGKSNSIAWLAHKLASFYQKEGDKERLFDSIVVITDRRILDRQLQNTIKQFEQTKGVVNPIDMNSAQLRTALQNGKDIIITTIQKFPFISENMTELKGNKFAVIIDEAHSSQSGETTKHLKKVLSADLEHAEAEDADDFDLEEEILKEIRSRGRQSHISYFAFTATPKNKTLELFGRKNPQGHFNAYHYYTMRQAIEENFILDVLENYTTYERYFKLMKAVEWDAEYDEKKAKRLLVSYVDLQSHSIEMKTRIMLEHFMDCTLKAIQGRGRAMVVTRSRLHAVKFYLMFKRVMQEMNLPHKPLVAFSGTVKDENKDYTENSLNRLPPKVKIEDAYKLPEYRILVVANKFQTGFDEPLLHTMYVDKMLGGVNAVQTLSRLNRTMGGKTNTVIIDFVNEAGEIQKSFQPYYQQTRLEEETDPNKLHTFEADLAEFRVYTKDDIREFCEIFYNPKQPQEKLQPILDRVVEVWKTKNEDEREDFRSILQAFIRLYGFVSQLITFEDIELEQLYAFGRSLNKKLPRRRNPLPTEVMDAVDLDSFRLEQTFEGNISLRKEDGKTKGIATGAPTHTQEQKDWLSHIIQTMNETYGINLSDDDKVDIERMQEKLVTNQELQEVAQSDNSRENVKYKFNKIVDELLLEYVTAKTELFKKLTEPKVNKLFKTKWFDEYYRPYQ
jgi:type I restriction enzyme R subunit